MTEVSREKTQNFIEKAKRKHGDKFIYTPTVYVKSTEVVDIICPVIGHGVFSQTPKVHLRGNGCQKCGKNYRYGTSSFIERAIVVHNGLYEYPDTNYINNHTKIKIKCKRHGDFEQTPANHLNGNCCPLCKYEKIGNIRRKSLETFIDEAIEIHGDEWDYSDADYEGDSVPLTIICSIVGHGPFKQTPRSHLNGHGCQKCGNRYTMTQEEFIEKAQIVHVDNNQQPLFDYSQTNFVNNKTPVDIKCHIHGDFSQIPYVHLKGHGCTKCSIKKRIDEAFIINKTNFFSTAQKIYGNICDYSDSIYNGSSEYLTIKCKQPGHGEFRKTPDNHIHKTNPQGCPKCQKKKQYSKSQIQWLNFIQLYNQITIQHGENGKEFAIQNTNYKADGYCEETNTIYEFHGDYWHGNPDKFNPTDTNKCTKKTYAELYQTTIEREQQIRDLGYNLVVMWENDWRKINKCLRVLQRKFKFLRQ